MAMMLMSMKANERAWFNFSEDCIFRNANKMEDNEDLIEDTEENEEVEVT